MACMVYSYIHFIDIKGTAWNHKQVIGTCSSILVALKGSQVAAKITCIALLYIVGYYAKCSLCLEQYNSGQEEATLCVIKCLKESRKLVLQMRESISVFDNNVKD